MKQTAEGFLRIEAIFHEALEAPAEKRSGLVEARCQGDPELATEVWSLLKACEAEAKVTESGQQESEAGDEVLAGLERVGPYAIDRLLGRGAARARGSTS